jgi:hypothetical protein
VPEYFTPLTFNLQVSTEDTDEIWETAKAVVMEKVRGRVTRECGQIRLGQTNRR